MAKKITAIIIAALILILGAYYNATKVNTKQIKIRQETIVSDKIDEDLDGLLVVYFSDLFYGKYIDSSFVNQAVEKINLFKPDVIIFGGNLVEQNIDQEALTQALSSLQAKHGKYATLGESDGALAKEILQHSGFNILENESQLIMADKNSSINIVGIDHIVEGQPDPAKAFSSVNTSRYTFAVCHCPDIFDTIENYEFDYLLCGHSLGGQIYFPIIDLFFRDDGCRNHYRGKLTSRNRTLDITNGLGRTGHNARLFADAEIVMYTLRSAK